MRCILLLLASLVIVPSAFAQVATTNPSDAMNAPSRHAWNLFMMLNHPAKTPDKLRGVPDPTKRVGDPGLAVWETWKSAGSEVFFPDGRHPGTWEDMTTENSPARRKVFDLPKSAIIDAAHLGVPLDSATNKRRLLRDLMQPSNKDRLKKFLEGQKRDLKLMNSPLDAIDPDGVFGQGGGETRMNKATFDFIVTNELYNIEGQESLFLQITTQGRSQLSFPVDSMEVKSMWLPLSPDDLKVGGKGERFHQGIGVDGKTYGLVALHIITKDIPKWFWCSFRQLDGPTPQIPSVDNFGRPSTLNGTKWQHYELSGTQTDFTDALGRPTLLSDPHIESTFEKTSCITCHAFANIGAPSTRPLGDRFPFFAFADPSTPVPPDATLDPESRLPIGNPPASVFFADAAKTQQQYVQLDFVFSTAFRARRKQTPTKSATEHLVHVSEFRYEPQELTIKKGETVVWVNDGKHSHNATRTGQFNTGLLAPGERSEPIKFETLSPADGFEYHCTPHPFMKGKIKVVE